MKQLLDKANENQKYQAELLSLILNNDDVYIKSIDIIRPGLFTGNNRIIFDSYTKMIRESKHPDAISISTESNVPLEEVLKVATYYSGAISSIDNILYELFDYYAKDKLTKLGANISQQITAGTDYESIVSKIGRAHV